MAMSASTPEFSIKVSAVEGVCPAGEVYAKQNIAEKTTPVLSCEGPCIRGEIARLSASDDVIVLLHQPGTEVPVCAVEKGCDLIILGTHGRTGFRHFVLGSVTERIVRNSEVPVLVVPYRD